MKDTTKDDNTTKTKSSLKWTDADDAILVAALAKAKVNSEWGDNNPKKVVWTACEAALKGSKMESGGAPKIGNTIKNRWNKVSTTSICTCMLVYLISQQLKQEYDTIKELCKLSGFGWDDAKMCVTAPHNVWAEYCKVSTSI